MSERFECTTVIRARSGGRLLRCADNRMAIVVQAASPAANRRVKDHSRDRQGLSAHLRYLLNLERGRHFMHGRRQQ